MCGKDAALLRVRSLVLEHAGFSVELAERADEVERLLNEQPGRFCVLVLCHTQFHGELEKLNQLAMMAPLPVLRLQSFLHPTELIREVSRRCEGGAVESYRSGQPSITDALLPERLPY